MHLYDSLDVARKRAVEMKIILQGLIFICFISLEWVKAQEAAVPVEGSGSGAMAVTFLRDNLLVDVIISEEDDVRGVSSEVIQTTEHVPIEETTSLIFNSDQADDTEQVTMYAVTIMNELPKSASPPLKASPHDAIGTIEATEMAPVITETSDSPINAPTEIIPIEAGNTKASDSPVPQTSAVLETTTYASPPSTVEPVVECTVPGNVLDNRNCLSYYACTQTVDGLRLLPQACPNYHAFDPSSGRCTRDLSPCLGGFQCTSEGTFRDPENNSSYYWCVPHVDLGGKFHIYRVQCGISKIFMPQLGKCFIDMDNLQNLPLNYELYMSKSADEEIIKGEVKAIKLAEKARLKEAKLRAKVQKKLEKELLKKNAKESKEQAKLMRV